MAAGAEVAVLASASGPAAPTPPEVLSSLSIAFGADKVGETGYDIAAAKCTSDREKAEAKERGSSLLYGEMLPDGVSKALLPERLGAALMSDSTVLELGMGSGKVALQIFLQCPSVTRVIGIELVPSRFAMAEAALVRLAQELPQRFRTARTSEKGVCKLEELASGRSSEFRCCDFFADGLDLVASSNAIFFAVHIPCRLFPQLCSLLARAKDGCRLFSYHSLESIWWSAEPCPFHQCEVNVPETDTFATSWSPQGYRFYVYVCDRSVEPEIDGGRNETFSEWQAVFDEPSGTYYYHNLETEVSQWEVPTKAGCWQALLCEEHRCYFFHHLPSGHSQWEVPKCLADLGWGPGGVSTAST